MKIALVTETYPPEINGVAMTLSQLTEGLRRLGHQVRIVRPRQSSEKRRATPPDHSILVPGVPIPRYADLRFGLPCRARLARTWAQDRPDIVHIATEGPLGLSAIGAARRLGIPTTSTFHTNFHSYSQHYNARFLTRSVLAYLRWIHNQTVRTMAPTQELADQLTSEGFRNMAVFGRGVQLDIFNTMARDEALRHSWDASPEAPVILHVSRLAAEKNYTLLQTAFEQIRQAQPNARFVVVGDGPLRKRLQKAMPYANFLGAIPLERRPDLARIYASADIFLYPSLTETYGNVLTEAMACGNAVAAFDYAAAAIHVSDGQNGLTAPLNDEPAFLRAALSLAENPVLRSALGAAAARYSAKLDWNPIVERFAGILQDASAQQRTDCQKLCVGER